jgi:hypothetical protein
VRVGVLASDAVQGVEPGKGRFKESFQINPSGGRVAGARDLIL